MKSLTTIIVLALAVNSYGQDTSTTQQQSNMKALEISTTILKTLESGWNHASGTEYAKPFAELSDFVDIRGTLHKSSTKTYIGEAHQGIFGTIYKDSKVVYEPLQASYIDDNTIVAHAHTHLDAPVGPLVGKNSSTITMLLIQTEGEWKIRAFHNTLVAKR